MRRGRSRLLGATDLVTNTQLIPDSSSASLYLQSGMASLLQYDNLKWISRCILFSSSVRNQFPNCQHRTEEGEEKLMEFNVQTYLLLLKHENKVDLMLKSLRTLVGEERTYLQSG